MRAVLVFAVLISSTTRPEVGQQVELRGKRLTVHLAAGSTNRGGPLLLYVTGDGGWPGDERLFERMAPWGYPMAAIDAIDYIDSINTPDRTLTPAAVAADFQAIIQAAQRGLKLPADHPAILVGFSRGAGLAVAAATQAQVPASLKGALLLALPPDEEFVTEGGRGLQTYVALPRLKSLRVAVLQSTRDEILSAAEARRRFGPDGPTRRFRALDAKDHSFGGSLPALEKEMRAALDWIVSEPK